MRFGTVVFLFLAVVSGGGCAIHGAAPARGVARPTAALAITGVWQGTVHETVTEGLAAGDSREEQQEWHLDQSGRSISGYYLAMLTYTSGDGRPYACNRAPKFSASLRIEVSGRMRGNSIDLSETARHASAGHCAVEPQPLARYRASVTGDVLTLVNATTARTERMLRRGSSGGQGAQMAANSVTLAGRDPSRGGSSHPGKLAGGDRAPAHGAPSFVSELADEGPRAAGGREATNPADVSGVWIWEHRGAVQTGDEKQEREEWHVEQRGDRISGYYDRTVREISTDGHPFQCSRGLEFEIATRYRIRGQVRGNQVLIFESSFEVLDPSDCDNGQRRLDAYEGLASGDEVRLAWGVGAQILRRPRPDVPTQHF